MMNPFYHQFKSLVGQGIMDDDNGIGDVYRSVLYQRGYGLGDDFDYSMTHGLGFADGLANLFRLAMPVIKSGMQFLGKKAVNTVANIAQDAIAGENIKDSAKKRITSVAGDIFAKAPSAIAHAFDKRRGLKRKSISSPRGDQLVTSARPVKRARKSRGQVGQGLLNIYPALKKIL
jgi:hypothetical protein